MRKEWFWLHITMITVFLLRKVKSCAPTPEAEALAACPNGGTNIGTGSACSDGNIYFVAQDACCTFNCDNPSVSSALCANSQCTAVGYTCDIPLNDCCPAVILRDCQHVQNPIQQYPNEGLCLSGYDCYPDTAVGADRCYPACRGIGRALEASDYASCPVADPPFLDACCGMSGYYYAIQRFWDGTNIDHEPTYIHMTWNDAAKAVRIYIQSPFFNDPVPTQPPGYLRGLWDYEVVEFFFLNAQDEYLEAEVGPRGHYINLLLDGERNAFNCGENLPTTFVYREIVGPYWRAIVELPLAYFPDKVIKFNSYAIHKSDPNRHYEALSPTDGTYQTPDFHRLNFFTPIDFNRVVPNGLNDQLYIDPQYGDLWGPAKAGVAPPC